MNSAALFSPFFFDFDFDFLCFLLRCDPERLLDLDRPRDDEEDDEELEEEEDDLGRDLRGAGFNREDFNLGAFGTFFA